MIRLEYPQLPFRTKKEDGHEYIFDEIRKTWLRLTPEEWVRQNFVQYLVMVKKYPVTLIAVEKRIRVGELMKRFDILVYDPDHRPWMMIECKSMDVELQEKTLQQILRYHSAVPVACLVITNGAFCAAFRKKDGRLEPLTELPDMES